MQYIVLDSRNYFFVLNFVVFHFKIVFFGYNYNTKKKNQKVEKKKKGIDAADLRNVLWILFNWKIAYIYVNITRSNMRHYQD